MLSAPRFIPRLLGLGLWLIAGACARRATEISTAQAATPDTPPSTVPGVDLTSLDEFERKVFFRVINKEPSLCGKAHSLLYSVQNDRGCRKSFYAVKYLARLVDAGYTDSELAEAITKRYRGGPPRTMDVTNAPCKGNPNARITIVEFVDYECPHCKRAQPVMRQVVEEFHDDVKVCLKHYPLGTHTNSRMAAEAAVAAQDQGKFWPYNDKVWANADSLTPASLEQFAKEVGLDVEKWRKDFAAPATKARVEKDHADGVALELKATPTIYLNGKLYTDGHDVDSLRDWVNEELGR